jgi:hypothetical protein
MLMGMSMTVVGMLVGMSMAVLMVVSAADQIVMNMHCDLSFFIFPLL